MSPPPNFELTLKLFVFLKKMYVLELYILHTSSYICFHTLILPGLSSLSNDMTWELSLANFHSTRLSGNAYVLVTNSTNQRPAEAWKLMYAHRVYSYAAQWHFTHALNSVLISKATFPSLVPLSFPFCPNSTHVTWFEIVFHPNFVT